MPAAAAAQDAWSCRGLQSTRWLPLQPERVHVTPPPQSPAAAAAAAQSEPLQLSCSCALVPLKQRWSLQRQQFQLRMALQQRRWTRRAHERKRRRHGRHRHRCRLQLMTSHFHVSYCAGDSRPAAVQPALGGGGEGGRGCSVTSDAKHNGAQGWGGGEHCYLQLCRSPQPGCPPPWTFFRGQGRGGRTMARAALGAALALAFIACAT